MVKHQHQTKRHVGTSRRLPFLDLFGVDASLLSQEIPRASSRPFDLTSWSKLSGGEVSVALGLLGTSSPSPISPPLEL